MASRPVSYTPDEDNISERQMPLTRSVLKRALLGLVLLFIMVAGGAWLMHASIEAEAETTPDTPTASLPAGPSAGPSR